MIPHWSFVTNAQDDSTGRIWVGWNPENIKLSVLINNTQMIHVRIEHTSIGVAFEASFIYGLHTAHDRGSLWRNMCYCADSVGSLPWICLGDYNVILHPNEVYGGNMGRDQGSVEFNECVNACSLVDLRYIGYFYTWDNRRSDSENVIKKKLDRAMVNQSWLDQFSSAFAEFLPSGISDHSPIIIHVKSTSRKKGLPFKFYNYWTTLD